MVRNQNATYHPQGIISLSLPPTDKDAIVNKREKETMIQDLKCDAVEQRKRGKT